MTPAQHEAIRRLWLEGRTYREIARAVGASWDAVRNHVRRHRDRWGERASASAPDPVAQERERARAEGERRRERLLVQVRAWQEDLRDALRTAVTALPVPPPPPHAASVVARNDDPETLVLILSDVHLGAHNRDGDGRPQSLGITLYQWRALERAVVKLARLEAAAHPIRRIVLLALGDLIEGATMRPSQAFQVSLTAPEQAAAMGRLLAELVQHLLALGDVELHLVPGNHDRIEPFPGLAGLGLLAPIGWSWVIGEMVGLALEPAIRAGRLALHNHRTARATAQVEGWQVVMEHGSSIHAGSSYGGIPAGPIRKAAEAALAEIGPYLFYALGHFHNANVLHLYGRSRVYMNGSFPAGTDYELTALHKAPRVPQQWLLSVHARQGVTTERSVWLPVPDNMAERLAPVDSLEEAETVLRDAARTAA